MCALLQSHSTSVLANVVSCLLELLWMDRNELSGNIPVELMNTANLGMSKTMLDLSDVACVCLTSHTLLPKHRRLILVQQRHWWLPSFRGWQVEELE